MLRDKQSECKQPRSKKLGLSSSYLAVIQTIITRALRDTACRVYLFGSRARGTHTPTSDIDIAVLATVDIARQLSQIREQLEDSAIPFCVDVVDLQMTAPVFTQEVQAEGRLLWRN